MDGRRVSNVQINSRRPSLFKKRQHETIGNLRIVLMYSAKRFFFGLIHFNFSQTLCTVEVGFFEQLLRTHCDDTRFLQLLQGYTRI